MAAKTRAEIDSRYAADMEVADAYRDENPVRYAEMAGAAKDRRADALGELADESDRRSAASDLENTRTRIQAKYPKAAGFPGAFAGSTEEQIEASAKAASDYIVGREAAAAEASRLASRGRTARAWSPSGSPLVPNTEISQESGGLTNAANEAAGRLATLRQVAGTKGAPAHALAGDEESTLRDLRASGRMRSTSDEAFHGSGAQGGAGVLTDEDRKG